MEFLLFEFTPKIMIIRESCILSSTMLLASALLFLTEFVSMKDIFLMV